MTGNAAFPAVPLRTESARSLRSSRTPKACLSCDGTAVSPRTALPQAHINTDTDTVVGTPNCRRCRSCNCCCSSCRRNSHRPLALRLRLLLHHTPRPGTPGPDNILRGIRQSDGLACRRRGNLDDLDDPLLDAPVERLQCDPHERHRLGSGRHACQPHPRGNLLHHGNHRLRPGERMRHREQCSRQRG